MGNPKPQAPSPKESEVQADGRIFFVCFAERLFEIKFFSPFRAADFERKNMCHVKN